MKKMGFVVFAVMLLALTGILAMGCDNAASSEPETIMINKLSFVYGGSNEAVEAMLTEMITTIAGGEPGATVSGKEISFTERLLTKAEYDEMVADFSTTGWTVSRSGKTLIITIPASWDPSAWM